MIHVFALTTPDGVMFHDDRFDIYPTREAAERARARYNISADGRFDGKVERLALTRPLAASRNQPTSRAAE